MRKSLASHSAYEVDRRFLFPHVTGGHCARSRHALQSPHHWSQRRRCLFLSASRHAAMVARGRGSACDTARSASARSASVRSAAVARFAAASRRKHSFLCCRCCCWPCTPGGEKYSSARVVPPGEVASNRGLRRPPGVTCISSCSVSVRRDRVSDRGARGGDSGSGDCDDGAAGTSESVVGCHCTRGRVATASFVADRCLRRSCSHARRQAPKLSKPSRCHCSITCVCWLWVAGGFDC